MFDLIDRKDLLEKLNNYCMSNCKYSEKQRDTMCKACDIGSCIEIVKDIAVYESEWDENGEQKHIEKCYRCHKCGFRAWGSYEKTMFCGGCGAKMKGCD